MIRARRSDGGVLLEGSLEGAQAAAYLDSEWTGLDGGELELLRVDADGVVRLGEQSWRAPDGADVDQAALMAFAALAAAAVAALPEPGRTLVTGRGVVAAEARRLLGAFAEKGAGSGPMAIDTTGDPQVIRDATQGLADGGTLVLAGRSLGRVLDLNLYPDVHSRGLKLVGVATPLPEQFRKNAGDAWGAHRGSLRAVALNEPVPSALWYRIER